MQIISNKICLGLIVFVILILSTPVQLRVCMKALDVVIVLQSSLDISDNDWTFMTHLSREVTYHLQPSTFGSHVALVQFSGNASVTDSLDTDLVIRDRSQLLLGTGRNVSNALETAHRLVLNNMDGDRPEVPDVIVFITNELADDRQSAVAEATRVKSQGIKVVTVGVTNTKVDDLRQELRKIATDPDSVDSLMLINRDHYPSVFSVLVRTVCRNRVEAANGSLRLVDGTSNTGKLEVYINEEWVTVCSTTWTKMNTRVACKQLGFPDGQSMYTVNQTSYHRRIGIANIVCTGNEANLIQCSHDPLFHIAPSCNHQHDVFLRCLCGDCNDYIPRDNVRLADRTLISGRLEVFSPGLGWGGVCNFGWTISNTRVACRQLGFLDGAGTFRRSRVQSTTLVLFRVNCTGNERSLFDCKYTTARDNCRDPIYIQCECTKCHDLLLQSPQQKDATTRSSVVFEWRLQHNVTDFEIQFISQKNPQTLLYVEGGTVVKAKTRFRHRIKLIHDDYDTVGFSLSNITRVDMGIYSLYVPMLLFDSKAILVVTDFAIVPGTVIHRQINDHMKLNWDLTGLRQLCDITYDILLTTPATGRLQLDYYNTHWLRDNPGLHVDILQPTDRLNPTVTINDINVKDAGSYIVEVTLTSYVHQWLNFSWQFSTDLVITDSGADYSSQTSSMVTLYTGSGSGYSSQTSGSGVDDSCTASSMLTIYIPVGVVLGVLLLAAIFAIIVLVIICRKNGRRVVGLKQEKRRLETERSRLETVTGQLKSEIDRLRRTTRRRTTGRSREQVSIVPGTGVRYQPERDNDERGRATDNYDRADDDIIDINIAECND